MAQKWINISKVFLGKTLDFLHFSRCAAWYFTSTKEYTKSAYERKSKSFKSFDDVNVKGKSFMVLGATGTIGAVVSEYLVKKSGITLHLLYHNEERGEELIQKLKPTAGTDTKIIPQKLDFTNIQAVKTFIDDFIKSKKDLHALVNCSMMVDNTQEKDEHGTDKTFLVNVLSPFIIITKFAEYLTVTSDKDFKKRIINCTCGNTLTVNVRIMDIELRKIRYKPLFQYSHEKKQIAVMLNFLAPKYPQLHFANIIPGWFESISSKQILPDLAKTLMNDLRTPEQGADSVLWAALSDEILTFKSGDVFIDRGVYKLSYLNQPNMIKSPLIAVYFKQIQQILTRYDFQQKVDKNAEKVTVPEKSPPKEIIPEKSPPKDSIPEKPAENHFTEISMEPVDVNKEK